MSLSMIFFSRSLPPHWPFVSSRHFRVVIEGTQYSVGSEAFKRRESWLLWCLNDFTDLIYVDVDVKAVSWRTSFVY